MAIRFSKLAVEINFRDHCQGFGHAEDLDTLRLDFQQRKFSQFWRNIATVNNLLSLVATFNSSPSLHTFLLYSGAPQNLDKCNSLKLAGTISGLR